ncbi:MAG: RNHCP domain-containing protein [Alphaproteobacteria bacterium]|nr:RNHCP domain-containing protein [Alphaproteobacteria bacterium]
MLAVESTAPDRIEALLALAAQGRRGLKAAAAELDAGAPALRVAVVEAARLRGVALPEEAEGWPAKRLLRHALGRAEAAQVRRNTVRVDEAFVCGHCGASVPPGGARVRDHCPRCLRSLHVDVVPGDRAARCGGLMDPVGIEITAGETRILYRCRRCGHAHRCRAHDDDLTEALAAASRAAGGA